MIEISFADAATGLFTGRQMTCPDDQLSDNIRPGTIAVQGRHDHRNRCIDFSTGEVVPYQPDPPADTDTHTWEWNTETELWDAVPTIVHHRNLAWERIKAQRTAAETAPLTSGGLVFDADPVSQNKIQGAVILGAMAGPTWSVEWTLFDNTSAVLTRDKVAQLGADLGARTTLIYAAARHARLAIEEATTVEQLDAITLSF